MPTYSLQQQLFAISLLVNSGSKAFGSASSIEQKLDESILAALGPGPLADLIGAWRVAWGPVVYEHFIGRATNVMFVAASTDSSNQPVYVVAVAATSENSIYDILVEDSAVTLEAWPYALPGGTPTPAITQGTIDGVNALRAMADPATGQTLQAFLSGVQGTADATLVFTGHSLGGALSPALALSLFGAPAGGTLNPSAWGAVYVYPTAGPTVGDQAYADFWKGVFPPVQAGGESWNELVWNDLDVVPHAWALLDGIDTLYPASELPWTPCLTRIQQGMLARVANAGGRFVQPQNVPLPGTFAPWAGAGSSTDMVTYFLTEMLHQHIWAYLSLLNVTGLEACFPGMSDPAASPTVPPGIPFLAELLITKFCVLAPATPNQASRGAPAQA
jgi:hypothetical protein